MEERALRKVAGPAWSKGAIAYSLEPLWEASSAN